MWFWEIVAFCGFTHKHEMHSFFYSCCACLQPFKLGDRVSVSYSAATPGVSSGISGGWFEGVCEKVDLRCGRIASCAVAVTFVCAPRPTSKHHS